MKTTKNADAQADDCKYGETCSKHPPAWFKVGEPLIWPTLGLAYQIVSARRTGSLNLDSIPELAAIHLAHCMEASIEANRKGRHAVAVCLVRQCVKATTIIEVGLQETAYRNSLLEAWDDETKSQGAIRKPLEQDVWPQYGTGLWSETWSDFFGEFARAVQPYAHYSQSLRGWQIAIALGNRLRQTPDGNYQFIAQIGLNTYDGTKATRITLLHCLIAWAMARIILANGADERIDLNHINQLGTEIGKSELLGGGSLKWHEEFWPHMFDKPK
jgi:hypothetical protein